MPIIDNAYPINEGDYAYSPSDMDITHKDMSRKDINNLIDSLCKTRMENPDVILMDQIKETSKFYDPIMQEQRELEQDNIAVEEEILKGIFESDIPMSIEERNELIANGMYQKYQDMKARKLGKTTQQMTKEDNEAMSNIEAELRANLNTPIAGDIEQVTEVISQKEIQESSFPVEFTEEKWSDGTGEIATPVEGVTLVEENTGMDAESVIDVFKEGEKEKPKLSKESINKVAFSFPSAVAILSEPATFDDNESLEDVIDNLNTTIDKVTSGEALTEALPKVEEDDKDKPMSIEEFNDVPVTEINLPDEVITSALMEQYDSVTYQDAAQLISVMNRYKAHEKFNVFEALPQSIKDVILKEAMSVGADRSTINFFAKSFINDLVNNTYLDREIKDFNTELQETLAPMGNIVGTMMDEYNDEVYDKFTINLLEKSKEIRDTDPEKANQLELVAKNFEESLSMIRIGNKISDNPSICNKHYKNGRDNWNKLVEDYNNTISKISPKPRDLDICLKGLLTAGYPEDYSKTIISLVVSEVKAAVEDGSLEEHIYGYYLTNSLLNLNYTANNSRAIQAIKKGVDWLVDEIDKYMTPLKMRNTKKNRKRNKRKR